MLTRMRTCCRKGESGRERKVHCNDLNSLPAMPRSWLSSGCPPPRSAAPPRVSRTPCPGCRQLQAAQNIGVNPKSRCWSGVPAVGCRAASASYACPMGCSAFEQQLRHAADEGRSPRSNSGRKRMARRNFTAAADTRNSRSEAGRSAVSSCSTSPQLLSAYKDSRETVPATDSVHDALQSANLQALLSRSQCFD
jgi:hypothetical protein